MVEFNDRRPKAQPQPQQSERFFHGQMDTERFSFDAFGRSEEEVHKALDEGFKHHLKQYGTSISEWKANTGAKRPVEHYEPNVREVGHGFAYRDGEELGGPKRRTR